MQGKNLKKYGKNVEKSLWLRIVSSCLLKKVFIFIFYFYLYFYFFVFFQFFSARQQPTITNGCSSGVRVKFEKDFL